MKRVAEQYATNPSKWSGKIIIDDTLSNDDVLGEKRQNCNIALVKSANDDTILHEMFHSCSASYYDSSIYAHNQFIEEASVEFLTQQVCKKQNIIFTRSYQDLTDILQALNEGLGYGTDLEFAKELFNIPLPKRYDWLKNKVLKTLRNEGASLQDCEEMEIYLKQLEGGIFYDKG